MSSRHDLPLKSGKNTLVVIPAWNESGSIQDVVRSVWELSGLKVLVVDDASSDGTGALARQAGAEVVRLSMNLGAWTAIQTGFRYALAHGYDTVITMDADGQHFAESIPLLLGTLFNTDNDVIIGANPDRATRCRQLSWSFFRVLTTIDLEDFTSGLKAYNHRAMHLLLKDRAHLFDYQDLGALLLMQRFGLKIQEVAVPMQKRMNGHSRVFSNWWQVMRYMLLSTALCISKFRHTDNGEKTCSGGTDAGL
ncbi:MAG: glycosyltransferase family 2 protein [Desulfobacterales bacterium]|nr:glycosyltransferase family 2 protein [Desulfobacterales bacterium]